MTASHSQARFDHLVKFDVFRFIRDHGIEYGFTEPTLAPPDLEALSLLVRSRVGHNLPLPHQGALKTGRGAPGARGSGEGNPEHQRSGNTQLRAPFETDGERNNAADDAEGSEEAWDLARAFWASLAEVCASALYPKFELGSLAFLRGQRYQPLMDDLTEAPHAQSDELAVHGLSATIFLPNNGGSEHHTRIFAAPVTTSPTRNDKGCRNTDILTWDDMLKQGMEPYLKFKALLAADFQRHEKDPKTNLGHTAIDERNFLMSTKTGRYLTPRTSLDCLLAIAVRSSVA